MEQQMDYRFGPRIEENGVTFRLWAPSCPHVQVEVEGREPVVLERRTDGFWEGFVEGIGPGAAYRFRANGKAVPDIASRQQRDDSDGWSIVRGSFGIPPMDGPLSPWHEAIICEVHVGTVTPEGTFSALMDRLEHFRDAGFTTLEIMPIADFPGKRNWGYDGTLIFAPDTSYGTPDDFRALVDRAHALGVCIVLDVVYNHFGSVHNFLPDYCPEWFDQSVETPWGPGIDFSQEIVRQFYYENAVWWLTEFDLDGLRFDAVHEIKSDESDRFLGDLAKVCRAEKPGCKLIIENMKNHAYWLTRDENDEPTKYSAQWNDSYHHVINFLVTGEAKGGYDDPKKNPIADLEKALADGFVHDGDDENDDGGQNRGGPAAQLPMEAFVQFVQNHDWIGNRADSSRLAERISPERGRFARFVTMLQPALPIGFMGDEGWLTSKFPFFYDLPEPHASEKAKDRYKQMRDIFNEEVEDGGLPDPQDPETFEMAKLDWSQYDEPKHREAIENFRYIAALRREQIWPLTATKCLNAWSARQGDGIICSWLYEAGCHNMALNPTDAEIEMSFRCCDTAATVGDYRRDGESVWLGPWSAVIWRS
jgi:malto-oligosyltrehalose trehalohydrolase